MKNNIRQTHIADSAADISRRELITALNAFLLRARVRRNFLIMDSSIHCNDFAFARRKNAEMQRKAKQQIAALENQLMNTTIKQ